MRHLEDLAYHNPLLNSLQEMGAALLNHFERIEVDTCNDTGLMIRIDAASQPGKSIATRLNNKDTRQISHEIISPAR